MSSSLGDAFDAKSYEQVLIMAANALSINPEDGNALFYQGKALANVRRYEEAAEALKQAERYLQAPSAQTKASQHAYMCGLFSAVSKKLADASKQAATEFPETWYRDRLAAHLEEGPSSLTGGNIIVQPDGVYILGPLEVMCGFYAYESHGTDVKYKLSSAVEPYPLTQAHSDGHIYRKKQAFPIPVNAQRARRIPYPICHFPTTDWQCLPPNHNNVILQPHRGCDVFVVENPLKPEVHRLVEGALDHRASATNDFFIPNYQNIIDPNLHVSRATTSSPYVWTATESILESVVHPLPSTVYTLQLCVRRILGPRASFPRLVLDLIFSFLEPRDCTLVRRGGRARLASPIPGLPPTDPDHADLYVAVESVLQAAAPLLAKLRKPALLLPGRLQTVVKAQRIYVNAGEDYEGVWHVDGTNEEVVAVVLYYYRVSEELQGGDLEFVSKQPRSKEYWLGGDCYMPENMNLDTVKELLDELPRCRVPVKTCTMVVFSNYQLVHRVLRMHLAETAAAGTSTSQASSSPGGLASRDFLALFVVDQKHPLPTTMSCTATSSSNTMSSSLPAQALSTSAAATAALEGLRDGQARDNVQVDDDNIQSAGNNALRWQLLQEQLRPAGQFGVQQELIFSTGNGSVAMMGWCNKDLSQVNFRQYRGYVSRAGGLAHLMGMNGVPPVGRGLSWALEKDAARWAQKKYDIYSSGSDDDCLY